MYFKFDDAHCRFCHLLIMPMISSMVMLNGVECMEEKLTSSHSLPADSDSQSQ